MNHYIQIERYETLSESCWMGALGAGYLSQSQGGLNLLCYLTEYDFEN